MFTSTSFGEHDEQEIRDLIGRYGLATLISHSVTAGLQATAVPALFDRDDPSGGTLIAHMAKANPHWRSIADGDAVLLLFRGPDAYVTPSLYKTEEDVPTWNYSAVQLRGHLKHARDAAENQRVLAQTVQHFEARLGTGWHLDDISRETVEMYSKGTASFSITMNSLEAAHKMSQDKRREDVVAVVEGLASSPCAQARAVAETMTRVTLRPGRHRTDR